MRQKTAVGFKFKRLLASQGLQQCLLQVNLCSDRAVVVGIAGGFNFQIGAT